MSEQLPLIEAFVVESGATRLPKPATVYLVAAWNVGGYWKIHRESNQDEFATVEAAEERARRLPPQWTHFQIIEVRLGGE